MTDHTTKSKSPPDTDGQRRKLRATYAWAGGLNTTLHYPHEFHVSLHGEPIVDTTGTHMDPMLEGDLEPAAAISAVLNSNDKSSANANSSCSHPDCIYNMGSAVERRSRHVLAIRRIDSHLRQLSDRAKNRADHAEITDDKEDCMVVSSSKGLKTVVDSGASRHLEVIRAAMRNLSKCTPVTLQGINGKTTAIKLHGSVGNCHNVLLAPGAAASVRSVSSLIDSHGCHVLFTPEGAYLLIPMSLPDNACMIAKRKEDGLFHLIPGSIPPAERVTEATAYLSVPQQMKRETIHHLHRVLAHASPIRMREILKTHPQLAPSLKPSDVRLFTNCDACGIGNANKTPPPEKAAERATAVGYRMHADTSGVISD